MSQYLFLKSPDIPGIWPLDSDGKMTPTDGKLVRAESYQHSLVLPTSDVRPSFSPEGFRQGYVEHKPFVLFRTLDACSPGLITAMLERTVMKTVDVAQCEMLEHGTKKKRSFPTPVWIIRMAHVVISEFSYEPSGSGGTQERIEFRYRSAVWSHRPVNLKDRSIGSPLTAEWNGKANLPNQVARGEDISVNDLDGYDGEDGLFKALADGPVTSSRVSSNYQEIGIIRGRQLCSIQSPTMQ